MTSQEILDQLAEIIGDMVSVPVEEITPEKNLTRDLEVDSLSTVEIMVFIQDEFGCKITDEVMRKFVTVGDVVAFVEQERERAQAPA
jgi:acyl carrier protein